MILDVSQISMQGNRSENQDCLGIIVTDSGNEGVFIVADGLGGHRGGAVAAQTAVNAVVEFPLERRPGWVERALIRANEAVLERASKDLETSTMRSTGVILHIANAKAFWAHVGDSRLYHLRESRIIDRTLDDSVVEVLRAMGELNEDEMGSHPDRSRLTKSLGMESELDFKVQTKGRVLAHGDRFLLCSDGIWENLKSGDLERISKMCPSSTDFTNTLTSKLSESGDGPDDNASLIVITVVFNNTLDHVLSGFRRAINK